MAERKEDSERPPESDFQQQNLKAWQPLLTPEWVIGTFAVIGILFLPIGIVIISFSHRVVEVTHQYDTACVSPPGAPPGCWVNVSIPIPQKMDPPVYFYYKLTNFYQNHRRYVKSRNDDQLRGLEPKDLSSCDPTITGAGGKKIYPCGLIANSYFNDTFTQPQICTSSGCNAVTMTDTGIAWSSDVKTKFKRDPAVGTPAFNEQFTRNGTGGFQLPLPDQEDFIVWMRTAGLPTFRKLRYIITDPLEEGSELRFLALDTFPVREFGGTKSIVLSTATWLGGKNEFLGWAYIGVGVVCIILALSFCLKHYLNPRPLGKMKYLNFTPTSKN